MTIWRQESSEPRRFGYNAVRVLNMRILILLLVAGLVTAADYRAPAGARPASKGPDGESILPGGRLVTPLGRQYATGPGPFGVAISPNGRLVVSANGGPDKYSLTVLLQENGKWISRHHVAPPKRSGSGAEPEEDDWHSVFMGLAFDGDDALY